MMQRPHEGLQSASSQGSLAPSLPTNLLQSDPAVVCAWLASSVSELPALLEALFL